MAQQFQPVTDPEECEKLIRAGLLWYRDNHYSLPWVGVADMGFLRDDFDRELFLKIAREGGFVLLLED